MLCLNQFQKNLGQLTGYKHFIVAYSGGVDSHVLLHLMSHTSCASLRAVYVNHGLSDHADAWQAHCASVCTALHIPFEAHSIQVIKKPRHSLEATARNLRYEMLSTLMNDETVLLTGHNENDQAETMLLQLMRGAGLRGLSAMPDIKRFHQGWQARPLLNVTRVEIEAYAHSQSLQWIEDESNSQTHFDRNFLRHQIMPELEKCRAGVVHNIVRSAAHIAEALELTQDLAAIDYDTIKGDSVSRVMIKPLKALRGARQSNVIRYWLSLQTPALQPPSQAVLAQIKQQLLYSYPGAEPLVRYHSYFLRRKLGYIEISSHK